MPRDLDLVVRLDLTAVRSSLGSEAAAALLEAALDASSLDDAVRSAVANAAVLRIGSRLDDFAEGDHVIVLEARRGSLAPPSPDAWLVASSDNPRVLRRVSARLRRRRESSEMFDLEGGRVLASPVEAPSVRRLLVYGPDRDRGEPEARGMLSATYRPRGPSRELERRYPSLGKLLGEVAFVDGVLEERAGRLEISIHLRCRTAKGSARVAAFFDALKLGAREESDTGRVLLGLESTVTDRLVKLTWSASPEELVRLLSSPVALEGERTSK